MMNIIEKKVYADGESYYFNTETMGRYGDIIGGLAWPEAREGFLVIAGVDLFENTELETRPIRVLAGVMESNIMIFLKYALELQKKFSPFMKTIRVYGDTTSGSMMELLDQFNKDRRQRGLDPFYLTEAPQLKSPKKLEFYAQLIRTYTQPGRKILHFCDTTLPSYLAGLPPEEISHGVLKHPPIAALAYAMAALSTWRPRKGEKRVGKEEVEVGTKYEPILTGKAIREASWRPPEISEPPK